MYTPKFSYVRRVFYLPNNTNAAHLIWLRFSGEKYRNGDTGFLRHPQIDHRGKDTCCDAQAWVEAIDVGILAPVWWLYVVFML